MKTRTTRTAAAQANQNAADFAKDAAAQVARNRGHYTWTSVSANGA